MIESIRTKLIENFNQAVRSRYLYETDLDKSELWNVYLSSFPEGANPIYKTRTVHDCSACRSFFKAIGNTVWIDERTMEIHSIFEFDTGSSIYQPVMDALSKFVKKHPIKDVYLSNERRVGRDCDRSMVGSVVETFEHFYLDLPSHLVYDGNYSRQHSYLTRESQKGYYRENKNVFKRSLEEISMEAIDTVLELTASKTLYRGEEWTGALTEFRKSKEEYERLDPDKKDAYAWYMSTKTNNYAVQRIRNHSIGVLLTDISEGMDLEDAMRKYEAIVAPANYKRPKAIFTKKMLEEAQKTVEELGYMNSLERRFARIDDINVHDILFSNKDAAKHIAGNVFDDLMKSAKTTPKNFSRVEKIEIERFIKDVLPTTNEMEVYFESRHIPNLVSLIAPVHKEAKSMFKWDNGFSWAYTGNIADSDIKANVKKAGGMVNAALRFSIQWNDGLEHDPNDLDVHCIESTVYGYKKEIFFGDMYSSKTDGKLDVDIIHPAPRTPAVENIVYPMKDKMLPGSYEFSVHCYSDRGGKSGFRAEIEFDGKIYQFNYANKLRADERIRVATVEMDSEGNLSIVKFLSSEDSSREIWGLATNQFIPVSVMMNSPNYWSLNDGKEGVGNKHYMFMLDGCINPEKPNGFYNEYLKGELIEHKRVFEALGFKMSVGESNDQLSGLGFSSTKRNDIIVKVKGSTERIMKVIF